MTLTKEQIEAARPTERPFKLYDGDGLYLLVNPNGTRWWRFRYKLAGREKLLSLGIYPEVTISRARAKLVKHRAMLADGIDPGAVRAAERNAGGDTFKAIAEEWLGKQSDISEETREQYRTRLRTYLYPKLGNRPVSKIHAADLLNVLQRTERQGRHETTHRLRSLAERIFRYAVVTRRATSNPAGDLVDALVPVKTKHHAAITDPKRLGHLLLDLDNYAGYPVTRAALRLAPLLFVRPGELRFAEWQHFDLDGAEWRIPGERMKIKEQKAHIVPLARQTLDVLRELQETTGEGKYLFPSLRSADRPMSENTVNAALRRLGYTKNDMTGHGFRTVASTLLNEKGHHPDVIERQLAHSERNKVRDAYNRAERLTERRSMMQEWADHLDELREAARKEREAARKQRAGRGRR